MRFSRIYDKVGAQYWEMEIYFHRFPQSDKRQVCQSLQSSLKGSIESICVACDALTGFEIAGASSTSFWKII